MTFHLLGELRGEKEIALHLDFCVSVCFVFSHNVTQDSLLLIK